MEGMLGAQIIITDPSIQSIHTWTIPVAVSRIKWRGPTYFIKRFIHVYTVYTSPL